MRIGIFHSCVARYFHARIICRHYRDTGYFTITLRARGEFTQSRFQSQPAAANYSLLIHIFIITRQNSLRRHAYRQLIVHAGRATFHRILTLYRI